MWSPHHTWICRGDGEELGATGVRSQGELQSPVTDELGATGVRSQGELQSPVTDEPVEEVETSRLGARQWAQWKIDIVHYYFNK